MVRALIVADSPDAPPSALIRSLASRNDVVIAADGGAARCLTADVTPDVVVGDLDSLAPGTQVQLRALGVRFVTAPAEKDVSDLDLAIEEARRLGAMSLDVAGVLGGRLDHEVAALGSLARAGDLRPQIAGASSWGMVLSAAGNGDAEVTGPREFSLFALLGTARVSCSEAHWTLTNASLEPISTLGLSNRVPDGSVAKIAVHEGVVLLYLP